MSGLITRSCLILFLTLSMLATSCSKDIDDQFLDAINEGDIESAQSLMNQGIDPNYVDSDGYSPLHSASSVSLELTIDLIEAGANVNSEDGFGMSPLHRAVQGSFAWYDDPFQFQIVNYLIDAGADVNAQDSYGRTPLHDLAEFYVDSPENLLSLENAIKLLVDKGAKIETRDEDGSTALHYTHSAAIAQLLIDLGAEVNAKDIYGETPLFNAFSEFFWESLDGDERGSGYNPSHNLAELIRTLTLNGGIYQSQSLAQK